MIARVVGTRLIYLDGARLAELRHAHDLTMRQAAQELGVTPAAICGWEHDTWVPREHHVDALRALYGDSLEASGALKVVDL